MDRNESAGHLRQLYKTKDWFHGVGFDQYGRIVVYVKFITHETLHDIPDYVDKHQVLVHLAFSLTATREQFTSNLSASGASLKRYEPPVKEAEPEVVDEADDKTLRHLTDELDKLEKMCGTNTLQDIFYEVHDGSNSVTNLSASFPVVRKNLERLYDQYGFDVIYEEMDG